MPSSSSNCKCIVITKVYYSVSNWATSIGLNTVIKYRAHPLAQWTRRTHANGVIGWNTYGRLIQYLSQDSYVCCYHTHWLCPALPFVYLVYIAAITVWKNTKTTYTPCTSSLLTKLELIEMHNYCPIVTHNRTCKFTLLRHLWNTILIPCYDWG